MFVIKYKGKYARFGSYCQITLVDRPEKATLYSTELLAKKRLKTTGGTGQFYNNGKPLSSKYLSIWLVKFTFTEALV